MAITLFKPIKSQIREGRCEQMKHVGKGRRWRGEGLNKVSSETNNDKSLTVICDNDVTVYIFMYLCVCGGSGYIDVRHNSMI